MTENKTTPAPESHVLGPDRPHNDPEDTDETDRNSKKSCHSQIGVVMTNPGEPPVGSLVSIGHISAPCDQNPAPNTNRDDFSKDSSPQSNMLPSSGIAANRKDYPVDCYHQHKDLMPKLTPEKPKQSCDRSQQAFAREKVPNNRRQGVGHETQSPVQKDRNADCNHSDDNTTQEHEILSLPARDPAAVANPDNREIPCADAEAAATVVEPSLVLVHDRFCGDVLSAHSSASLELNLPDRPAREIRQGVASCAFVNAALKEGSDNG